MNRKLSRGIVQVLIANFINLFISLCNGFLIPKYLSVPSYAEYKTFLFYTSYIGVLHIGFIDGVYLKYGGKTIDSINKQEFSSMQITLFVQQCIVTILGFCLVAFIKDEYLVIALLCVLPYNMQAFYKFIFQATGEFSKYRRILNVQVISVFLFDMFLLLILRINDAKIYAISYLIISFAVWVWFSYSMRSKFTWIRLHLNDMFLISKDYIKMGFVLMLGNFMSVWISGIDRWFVKIMCTDYEFAYYSFAVSLLRLINVVFGAFSVTLYNYFCDHNTPEQVSSIRRKVLMIGSLIISSAFVFKVVIDYYLPQYIMAERIMIILILSQLFVVIVNAIYLNLYKAKNMQMKYLKIMVAISIIAVVLNALLGYIFGFSMETFAYATLITMIIWSILCQVDMKAYKQKSKEWIYILIISAVFLSIGSMGKTISFGSNIRQSLVSFILYILFYLIISCVCFKNELLEIVFMARNLFSSSKNGLNDKVTK